MMTSTIASILNTVIVFVFANGVFFIGMAGRFHTRRQRAKGYSAYE